LAIIDLKVLGTKNLEVVAAKLRAAGRTDLIREMRRGIEDAVDPLPRAIRASALATLPSSGGYAATLAASLDFKVSTRLSGRTVRVIMTTVGEGKRQRREIVRVDQGVLRHPVYGRTRYRKWRTVDGKRVRIPGAGQPIPNPWVAQRVRPHFWTRPVDDNKDKVVREVADAIARVAAKI
jgi:hypothetical protein